MLRLQMTGRKNESDKHKKKIRREGCMKYNRQKVYKQLRVCIHHQFLAPFSITDTPCAEYSTFKLRTSHVFETLKERTLVINRFDLYRYVNKSGNRLVSRK